MPLHLLTLATFYLALQTVPASVPFPVGGPTIAPQPTTLPAAFAPRPMPTSPTPFAVSDADDSAPRDEEQRLLRAKIAELDRLQREVDQLRAATRTPQQILVKVQMLEVNLTQLQKLGIDFSGFTSGLAGKTQSQPGTTGLAVHVEPKVASGFFVALKHADATVLAEPTVVVISGRPASVNVGGEFPLPGVDGKPVEFRKFGTQLDINALAMGNNQVRLEIRTRVSQIDDAHAIVIGGARVPSLNVREFNTALEMPFGQTAVLSGLVQQRTESQRSENGVLEEKPIEVGLAVVVTPEFVHPLDPTTANRDATRGIK
jgi:Flp pilus assembly secretin CpaC